ncbi:MAG: short chain dehydrogenase [Rhodobacterales bacterium]|nr:MAG: short chain dehydrogenase [Rhodobacterales bacterium]
MRGAALITGAADRLGRAMAVYLAGRGFDVAVHYASNRKGAEETAARCANLGAKTVLLEADLLRDCDSLVPRATDALGSLTLLINNASIFEFDDIASATPESWERHIGSNLRAPLFLSQAFAAQAPKATPDADGEPRANALIVNMVDQRVRKLTPAFLTYTLAKSGLWTLTQTTAQALAPHIRVNAIGPGPTLQGARQSKAHFDAQRAATILKRGANPGDITAALGFFLDSPAVTGQLIAVDGGQHLAWQTPDILGRE